VEVVMYNYGGVKEPICTKCIEAINESLTEFDPEEEHEQQSQES